MRQRSILAALPVTLLAVAAIAAPVWASDDDDDGDDGQVTPPTTPFVQAPAPAPLAAPPAPTPVVASPPSSSTAPKVVPARENRKRTTRKARKHTPRTTKVLAARQRTVRAVAVASRTTTVPRGGVQAGMGGMAR